MGDQTKETENKPTVGRWKKGESGNPGGRPKAIKPVIEAAREWSTEALQTLVDHLANPDGRVAVAAANAILDRAWGKPSQSVHIEQSDRRNLDAMSDAELVALATGVAIESASRSPEVKS